MALARIRFWSLPAAVLGWALLLWMTTWPVLDAWAYQPDVTAPLTRRIFFYHVPAAWTTFVAYFVVFAASVAYLNERTMKYDVPAQAAAEVGFLLNTVALATGTLWGMQEWARTGQNSLATVYSEPKVLVVLVMWFVFAGYLMLRKFVDDPDSRARLSAIFGVLGFLGVPLSYASSRLIQTSLHPDVIGPGKNPDAAIGGTISWMLLVGFLAWLFLFLHLWLRRTQLLHLEETLEVP